ncbi:YfbU family protein [Deinococcus cellulosilyticus]|uniref:YfbU family protein n=1 Tax=Deinococcus cellulosilyticus (strain DSM 18568 / NBRC 106333 / KACC 11606 / 5516J-15) TaxID=1223518 RepID=A0A511NAB3_DEIC1|nr:YfbU family protein [Deinococcus cellulosilyticus]GEM49438.1 hypothetical protein DC3_50730 [Deinococcus cellulosilyticus NBRC 106333 = KACC 11606]
MTEKLTLTVAQRLNLILQYRILELLDPENREHHQQAQTILKNGYTLSYRELTRNLQEELPIEVCQDILDILEMYEAILDSKEHLGDPLPEGRLLFPGFSEADESHLAAYAAHVVDVKKRFSSVKQGQKKANFAGRIPMMDQYRLMLEKFRQVPFSERPRMSRAVLDDLLNS